MHGVRSEESGGPYTTWWIGVSLAVLAILVLPQAGASLSSRPLQPVLLVVALILWALAVYARFSRAQDHLVNRLYWLNATIAVAVAYGAPAPSEVSWDRPVEIVSFALLPALFLSFFASLATVGPLERHGQRLERFLWFAGIGSGIVFLAPGVSTGPVHNLARLILFVLLLAGFTAGLTALVHAYTRPRSEHNRRQVQAVLVGAALAVLPVCALYLVPVILGYEPMVNPQLVVVTVTFLPISFVYAIVRHRLFDIDAVVSRSLAYAIMTGVVAGLYALLLGVVNHLRVAGPKDDTFLLLIFFAAVTATFAPLHGWIREIIDRVVYRDRYDYAQTLRELGAQLASVQPLDEVLSTVAERLARTLNLSGVAILLPQPEGGFAVRGASGDCIDSQAAHALVRRASSGLHEGGPGLWIPLQSHDQGHGLLYLGPKRMASELSGEDISLAETLALHAAVAVDNALLVDRLRNKITEMQILRSRLLRVQDEERKRLAEDLHDGVLQTVWGVVRHADASSIAVTLDEATARLDAVAELGRDAAYQLRTTCSQLYPPELADLGLPSALQKLADATSFQEDVSVGFSTTVPDDPRLPQVVEEMLYRIVREAVSNIVRHSGARTAHIALSLKGPDVELSIRDDGNGFMVPPQGALARRGHLGLVGMRERAERLGGEFSLLSSPGSGTEVCVKVRALGHDLTRTVSLAEA